MENNDWLYIEALLGHVDVNQDEGVRLGSILHRRSASRKPDDWFMAGFVAYHFGELVGGTAQCEPLLRRVLDAEPAHCGSIWYLACYYFDNTRWAEALSLLRSFEEHCILAAPVWKKLKWQELAIVSRLYLRLSVPTSEMQAWIQDYQDASEEDRPVPIELRRVLGSPQICLSNGTRDKLFKWLREHEQQS